MKDNLTTTNESPSPARLGKKNRQTLRLIGWTLIMLGKRLIKLGTRR